MSNSPRQQDGQAQDDDQSINQPISQLKDVDREGIDVLTTRTHAVTIHSFNVESPAADVQSPTSPASTNHLNNQSISQSINPYWPPRLFKEVKSRIPYYVSDWKDAYHRKIISAAFFILFVSIAPSLTFGEYLIQQTNQSWGVTEVLFSCALSSIVYALLSGQPITIVGVSGPITILARTLHSLCITYEINFIVWFAWANIWAALFHLLLCMFNGSSLLVSWITRFSEDVFGMLISVIFITNTIEDLVKFFGSSVLTLDAQYFCFILTIGVALLALTLNSARDWRILNGTVRDLIADYAMVLSCLFWCLITYLPHFNDTRDTLPFLHVVGIYVPNSYEGRVGESWAPDLTAIPVGAIFAAILPAILITALFWFDHCVSKLSCEAEQFNLKKPTDTFNWDFALLGMITLMLGLLGLPPVNGIIPQCGLHAKALMVVETSKEAQVDHEEVLLTEEADNQSINQSTGAHRRRRVSVSTRSTVNRSIVKRRGVLEQRVSNLMQGILTAVVLCLPSVLSLIPRAVLSGVFLFMGITGLTDNQLWHRIWLMITDEVHAQDAFTNVVLEQQAHRCLVPNTQTNQQSINQSINQLTNTSWSSRLRSWLTRHQLSKNAQSISYWTIYAFTILQFCCFAVVYGITWTDAGVAFPLFILLLIPLRKFILPKLFSVKQLILLDSSSANPTWPEEAVSHSQSGVQLEPMPTYADTDGRHIHIDARSKHHHEHKEEIHDV